VWTLARGFAALFNAQVKTDTPIEPWQFVPGETEPPAIVNSKALDQTVEMITRGSNRRSGGQPDGEFV